MNPDYINLAIRFLILFFVAATSEVAITKKHISLAFLLFALWISFFRLTALRAVSSYVGVFSYDHSPFVNNLMASLTRANLTNVTDFIMLVAVIILFIDISKTKKELKFK